MNAMINFIEYAHDAYVNAERPYEGLHWTLGKAAKATACKELQRMRDYALRSLREEGREPRIAVLPVFGQHGYHDKTEEMFAAGFRSARTGSSKKVAEIRILLHPDYTGPLPTPFDEARGPDTGITANLFLLRAGWSIEALNEGYMGGSWDGDPSSMWAPRSDVPAGAVLGYEVI